MNTLTFKTLDQRRREVGMTYARLAARSGLSMPTVIRILSGNHFRASFENVCRVARAVGVELEFKPTINVETIKTEQAERKAAQVMSWLQGTSGLEGQGLSQEHLKELRSKTVREILVGPKKNLWGD